MHSAFVVLVLLALAALPWLIAMAILAGEPIAERTGRVVSRLRSLPPTEPVEELAARLRRLSDELVHTPAAAAYRRADLLDDYDRTLRRACVAVGVSQELNRHTGFELEVERLRVVEALSGTGLIVHNSHVNHDHRGCQ